MTPPPPDPRDWPDDVLAAVVDLIGRAYHVRPDRRPTAADWHAGRTRAWHLPCGTWHATVAALLRALSGDPYRPDYPLDLG